MLIVAGKELTSSSTVGIVVKPMLAVGMKGLILT